MRLLLLVSVVALAGCVGAQPVTLPSGAKGFLVTCNTEARDIGDCYNKASEMCHGPYEVLERNEGSQTYYNANQYMATGGSVPKRSIMVQCK